MAKTRTLGVWLYDRHVADISSPGPGKVVCKYTTEAIDTWPLGTPLLSCSLPLGSRPIKTAGLYFRGMLPEGQHLQAMAQAANVASYDTFGMLARFGRDVAGAAVIAENAHSDRDPGVRPYTDVELDDEVAGLEDRPLALYDDSELSIAGLQNKLLLVATPDGWARPVGGYPSTHILKVEDRRYPGLVTMEAACLRIARAVGLTSVEASVETIGGVDCLIVSRFDRGDVGGVPVRLHQEDACQALGRDPDAADRKGKYEVAGGPSLRDIAGLLDTHAARPVDELHKLVGAATFTTLIGNADAHGKNVAFVHTEPGRIELAPLYDTVPTVLWPKLPDRAAMFVNGRVNLPDVTIKDVVDEARTWPLDGAHATAVDTVDKIVAALDEVNPPSELNAAIKKRAKAFTTSQA